MHRKSKQPKCKDLIQNDTKKVIKMKPHLKVRSNVRLLNALFFAYLKVPNG